MPTTRTMRNRAPRRRNRIAACQGVVHVRVNKGSLGEDVAEPVSTAETSEPRGDTLYYRQYGSSSSPEKEEDR